MTTWTNAEQIKDEVSLVDLLARLGHAPAYRSGKELFTKVCSVKKTHHHYA